MVVPCSFSLVRPNNDEISAYYKYCSSTLIDATCVITLQSNVVLLAIVRASRVGVPTFPRTIDLKPECANLERALTASAGACTD